LHGKYGALINKYLQGKEEDSTLPNTTCNAMQCGNKVANPSSTFSRLHAGQKE
jgi:hypothetical protein